MAVTLLLNIIVLSWFVTLSPFDVFADNMAESMNTITTPEAACTQKQ